MIETTPHIRKARCAFHGALSEKILTVSAEGVPSNADKDNKTSVRIATEIAKFLPVQFGSRSAGQTSGNTFETLVADFVRETFLQLPHLRPGKWIVEQVQGRRKSEISRYAQYAHLIDLNEAASKNHALAAALAVC